MGKKPAQKKEPKNKQKKPREEVEDEEPAQEDQKFEVFTPKFYETIDSFRNFCREVLTLKAKEQGSDVSNDFAEVAERVSGKLEEEANKILKEELSDIEHWVSEQQDKVAADTTKIEDAYKANTASLDATGSFSQEEIRKQLAPVQARIDEKKATYDSFGALLERAKEVYQ